MKKTPVEQFHESIVRHDKLIEDINEFQERNAAMQAAMKRNVFTERIERFLAAPHGEKVCFSVAILHDFVAWPLSILLVTIWMVLDGFGVHTPTWFCETTIATCVVNLGLLIVCLLLMTPYQVLAMSIVLGAVFLLLPAVLGYHPLIFLIAFVSAEVLGTVLLVRCEFWDRRRRFIYLLPGE